MDKKGKVKITLTYIESGMGHITSMKAIEEALLELNDPNIEIEPVWLMKDDKRLEKFEVFLSNATKATNKKKAFGFGVFIFLKLMGSYHFMRFIHRTIFRKPTNVTIDKLASLNSDIIVVNHYFTTFAAAEMKRRKKANSLTVTYNPDNNIHTWWEPGTDLFINNNYLATESAIRAGFPKEKLRQVCFTARPEILQTSLTSKQDLRKKWEIDDNFTVIVADGIYASAKSSKTVKELLRQIDFPINIILIAGKNEKVRKKFEKIKKKGCPSNINLRVLPFLSNAHELYRASDLFITKAGPNSIIDSLYAGTPVLISYYGHPIEKSSCKLFVDELGCGVKELKIKKIPELIKHLYTHPEWLEKMKENISKHIHPDKNGAKEVAKILQDEAKNILLQREKKQ